jgi:23S rRNA pseudouridine1911/1915/1917 synthase
LREECTQRHRFSTNLSDVVRGEGYLQKIEIVYQDKEVAVVAKPPGVPSQPDRSGDESVLSFLSHQIGGSWHPVHRLDRPASGLLLCARTRRAAAGLSRQMRSGTVVRRYWAIVAGAPKERRATLQHRLTHDRRANKATVNSNGSTAILEYRLLTQGERYSLLEVTLDTGRTHQIRAQLSAIGHPIRGDLKYGSRRSQPEGGIALHAVELSFRHPGDGRALQFTTPPPQNRLWDALAPRSGTQAG